MGCAKSLLYPVVVRFDKEYLSSHCTMFDPITVCGAWPCPVLATGAPRTVRAE